MGNKFNTDNTIKEFEKLGYKYISGESKNQYSKLSVMDKDGYMYLASIFNIIRRENSCFRKFHTSNTYTIYNIKNFLKLEHSNTKLLDDKYNGANEMLNWECGCCGNHFERKWSKMKQSKTFLCNDCAQNIVSNKTRIDKSDVIGVLNEKGWNIIDDNFVYNKNNQLIDVISKEGFKASTNITNIKSCKDNIDIINKRNPYTIHNMNIILQQKGLPFTILEQEYHGNTAWMDWKCNECDEIFKRKWANFQNGGSMLCPKCSLKSKSYISYCVMKWLETNNIKYSMEYKFEDCKDKRPLPFDYYLIDKNILIEVDGKQHYEITYIGCKNTLNNNQKLEDKLKITKMHDNIKNEYCIKNNIKLLRLPYWKFKNDEYIKILEKEIL